MYKLGSSLQFEKWEENVVDWCEEHKINIEGVGCGKGEKEELGKVVGWVVLGIFEVGKGRDPPSWLGGRKNGAKAWCDQV